MCRVYKRINVAVNIVIKAYKGKWGWSRLMYSETGCVAEVDLYAVRAVILAILLVHVSPQQTYYSNSSLFIWEAFRESPSI